MSRLVQPRSGNSTLSGLETRTTRPATSTWMSMCGQAIPGFPLPASRFPPERVVLTGGDDRIGSCRKSSFRFLREAGSGKRNTALAAFQPLETLHHRLHDAIAFGEEQAGVAGVDPLHLRALPVAMDRLRGRR